MQLCHLPFPKFYSVKCWQVYPSTVVDCFLYTLGSSFDTHSSYKHQLISTPFFCTHWFTFVDALVHPLVQQVYTHIKVQSTTQQLTNTLPLTIKLFTFHKHFYLSSYEWVHLYENRLSSTIFWCWSTLLLWFRLFWLRL